MIWLWIAIIVVVLLMVVIALVLYPKLSIIVKYKNGNVLVILKTFLFRVTFDEKFLQRFLRKKEGGKKTEKEKANKETVDGFFAKIEKLKTQYLEVKELVDTILRYTGSRVEISDIFIRTRFGCGDAAATGMAYGAIWVLIGNLYAFLCRFVNTRFPQVELIPDYNGRVFEIEGEGIIKIRPVHIIGCVLKIAKLKAEKASKK